MEWKKATKFSASQMRVLKRQGITVLVILIFFGSYFLIRVPSQRAFYVDRSFAALARMSERIESAIENAVRNGRNAVNDASVGGAGPVAAGAEGAEGAEGVVDPALAYRARLDRVLQLIPGLQLVSVRRWTNGVPDGPPPPRASLRVAGRSAFLDLAYVTTNEPAWEAHLEANLGDLVAPVLDRRLFDDLAVVDEEGTCLFQLEGQVLRVAGLALPSGSSFRTNMADLAGADQMVFVQPVSLALGGGAPAADNADPATGGWRLCGIISAERFRDQTLKMSYEVIVQVVSLALLLVVSWPLLDWSSIAPGGSVSRVRLAGVAWASVLLFGLLTTFLLDQLASAQLRRELDRQLAGLAGEIQSHFGRELDAVLAQLEDFHERYRPDDAPAGIPDGDRLLTGLLGADDCLEWAAPETIAYPFFEMVFWADPQGRQQAKWTVRQRTTPLIDVSRRDYFKAIANGVPWKRSHPSGLDLHGRAAIPNEQAAAPTEYAIQSIYSWNTGENLAILSLPWEGAMGRGIAAIDVRFLSLFNPVIAGGFGFCVVDAAGGVAFHSDARRNLRENFIEACNRDARLRAAISGQTTDTFSASYLLAPHRLHVTPVRDTPWTLVVFRDERMPDTARLQIASVTGGWVLILVLWIGCVVALLPWVGGARSGAAWGWVWPDRRRAGDYAVVAKASLGALAVALFFLGFVASRGWLVGAAFLLPALALGLTARFLIRSGSRPLSGPAPIRPPWSGCFGGRSCYLVAATTLFLLAAVFPAMACFKAAYNAELTLTLRDHQLDLARDLRSRREAVEQYVRGLGFGTDAVVPANRVTSGPATPGAAVMDAGRRRQAFLDLRRATDLDCYTKFFFTTQARAETNVTRLPVARESRLFAWLDGLRAPYGDAGALRRRVAASRSPGRPWVWAHDGDVETMVWEGWNLASGAPSALVVRSERHGWPQPPFASAGGLLPWLGLAALPLLAWGVLALLARRYLLLAGTVTPPVEPLQPGGWYLLLGPPAAGKTAWLAAGDSVFAGPETQHLDLRRPADRSRLGPRAARNLHADPDRPMVIDHFEFGSDDPELTRRKLALLRDLVATNRRGVVVVSNLHPLHFLRVTPDGDPQANARLDAERRAVWGETLGLLRRVDKTAPGDASAEQRLDTVMLRRQRFKPLWDLCTDAEREVLHQLACGRVVRSDCPEVAALLGRGLLIADPVLALQEPRFAAFVERNYRPASGGPGAAAHAAGWWHALRGPILTLVAFGALFFLLTQPERWNQMLALAAAFVSGLGVLKDLSTRGTQFTGGKFLS